MISIVKFSEFINNLEDPIIELGFDRSKAVLRTIDLKVFSRDIHNYSSFLGWWDSIALGSSLKVLIIKKLLESDPPEELRQGLLFLSYGLVS